MAFEHGVVSGPLDHDELMLARIGAGDPQLNLRRDPAFIIRRHGDQGTVFASVIESHGGYDPVTESAANSRSNVARLGVVHNSDDYLAVSIEDLAGVRSVFVVSAEADQDASHQLDIDGQAFEWQGPFHLASDP